MQETPASVAQSAWQQLKSGRIDQAHTSLRAWLASSTCVSLYSLLTEVQKLAGKKHLMLMLEDLLTGYPSQLIGCPVLLMATPNELIPDEPVQYPSKQLVLPGSHPLLSQPSAGLEFVGWVPPRLVALQTIGASLPELSIPWGTPIVAIALFRQEDRLLDEPAQAPAGWWGELFSEAIHTSCISLTGPRMFPYPQAVDAGRCMLAVVNRKAPPPDLFFLREDQEAVCARDARLFQPN